MKREESFEQKQKWYEQFSKSKSTGKIEKKRKVSNLSRKKINIANESDFKSGKSLEKKSFSFEKDAQFESKVSLFNFQNLPKDSIYVLENFDSIVQGVWPMNTRQINKLPKDIFELSHQLTDQRESRRMGYMNAKEEFSAYLRYFTWWNIVRLTRVFSNLPENAFSLEDGNVCIDLGCGPLTVVISLWLSRPELRNKKLTWYCIDLSANSMSIGEELYLSIAAKVRPSDEAADSHWNIIRVKGEPGVQLKRKASFIASANMFNELSQKSELSPEELAKKQMSILLNYSTEKTAFFLAEPGMPVAAHFLSLMRDQMIEKGFNIVSPCPHQQKCPMSGLHARYGGTAKWCNFSFLTQNVPLKLQKLSAAAKLPKDRAVISFVYGVLNGQNSMKNSKCSKLTIRIASDKIKLPDFETGFYACSEIGLVLAITSRPNEISCGDSISLKLKKDVEIFEKDKKTGAKIIRF